MLVSSCHGPKRVEGAFVIWESYRQLAEGEIFGWSSMVDRESYTTTAKCLAPTKVIRISRRKLNHLFEKHPHDGMVFYKRLADAVLQTLIDTSSTYLTVGNLQGVAYDSGQVIETLED